jgi:hypothetical protein
MGNICSMIDADRARTDPPRLHASELAPSGYAAERLQQLGQLAGAADAQQQAQAHQYAAKQRVATASPDRRIGGAAATSSSQTSENLPAGSCAAAGARDSDAWRIPAVHGDQPQQPGSGGVDAADGAGAGGGGAAEEEGADEAPLPFSWTKGELVGAGAFGRVFTGLNNESGEIIAVKQVRRGVGRVAVNTARMLLPASHADAVRMRLPRRHPPARPNPPRSPSRATTRSPVASRSTSAPWRPRWASCAASATPTSSGTSGRSGRTTR